MFTLRSCIRQTCAITRRFVSIDHRQALLSRQAVARALYDIDQGFPARIPNSLQERLSKENDPKVRREVREDVINVLFHKKCYDQALQIWDKMGKDILRVSAPTRAKMYALLYSFGYMNRKKLLERLRSLFESTSLGTPSGARRHLSKILIHIGLSDNPLDLCEEVLALYIKFSKQKAIDPKSVAFMMAHYIGEDRESDAVRWLDYHSSLPPAKTAFIDPASCVPYSIFAHAQLIAKPNEDPQTVYTPILHRMSRDGAWPDTVLINILITAELRHNHMERAFALYDVLRSHTARHIYPDETTYSQLFDGAGRRVRAQQRKRDLLDFPISPRVLFREMLELHTHVEVGHFRGETSVLTQASLGAALRQFTTSADYAAALVALKTYMDMKVPLEHGVIRAVLAAIARRCLEDLKSGESVEWVDVFLDLGGIDRRRYRDLSTWEMARRVISVTRRASILSDASDEFSEFAKREDETFNPSSSMEAAEAETKTEKTKGRRTRRAKAEKPSIREEKKNRMREYRFGLVDVMLSRALASTFVAQGLNQPEELGKDAIGQAEVEMMPNLQKIASGTLDETRQKLSNPTPLQES